MTVRVRNRVRGIFGVTGDLGREEALVSKVQGRLGPCTCCTCRSWRAASAAWHEGCQPDCEEYQRDFPIAVPELASSGGLDAGEGEGFVIVQVINDFVVRGAKGRVARGLS